MVQAGNEYFMQAVVGKKKYTTYCTHYIWLIIFIFTYVGGFNAEDLLSNFRTVHTIDFNTVSIDELQYFEIPFSFPISKTGIIHGMAGWFDIQFKGSQDVIVLSTAPDAPLTHWYIWHNLLIYIYICISWFMNNFYSYYEVSMPYVV